MLMDTSKYHLTNLECRIIKELLSSATTPLAALRLELNHIISVLEWIEKLNPNAPKPLRYAGLLHDCDRLYPKRAKRETFADYESYKRAHAKQCALFATLILKRAGIREETTRKTQLLIEDHEWGTTSLSYLLMAADSLSFFSVNIVDYLETRGTETTRKKISFMYVRLKRKERQLLHMVDLPFKHISPLYRLFRQETRTEKPAKKRV